jgi:hypothetical protein
LRPIPPCNVSLTRLMRLPMRAQGSLTGRRKAMTEQSTHVPRRRRRQGLGSMRPSPETERTGTALETLRQAIASARLGDHQRGRELCASVLFDIQPLLARRKTLLRTAVLALLVSQGFRLLTRVVVALTGHRIRVVLELQTGTEIGQPRFQEETQEILFTVDPRWLAQLTGGDPFLLGWCEALAGGRACYAGSPAQQQRRMRLSPEPV